MGAEWPWTSLIGAYRLLTRDPMGILAPTLLALLVTMALSWQTFSAPMMQLWWVYVALLAAQAAVTTPLRAWMVARGARAAGARSAWLPWTLAEWMVQILELVALLAVLIPGVVAATWLAAHRLPGLAGAALALAWLGGLSLRLASRGLLGLIPHLAAVDGLAGVKEGMRLGVRQWPAISLTWLGGGFFMALGSLFCGVGALVAYPLADLALLRRRLAREEVA